jgi:5S rRNA maturation endonuclease (ribonuclease M5)
VAERELEVAMELIGEVFNVGGDEVRKMIKERMARKGMIKDTRAVKKRSPKKKAKKGVEKAAEEETPAE